MCDLCVCVWCVCDWWCGVGVGVGDGDGDGVWDVVWDVCGIGMLMGCVWVIVGVRDVGVGVVGECVDWIGVWDERCDVLWVVVVFGYVGDDVVGFASVGRDVVLFYRVIWEFVFENVYVWLGDGGCYWKGERRIGVVYWGECEGDCVYEWGDGVE